MTATFTPTAPSTTQAERSAAAPSLWRTGAVAGAVAAGATVAVAATAHAAGVPIETAPGETIPLLGFAQLTLFFTLVGVLLARSIARRARQPRATLTKVTVGLTLLSVVPDVMISAGTATKVTLVLTHLVAAAIVIPALSSRMPELATG